MGLSTTDAEVVQQYFVDWWEWVRGAGPGGLRRPEWAMREPRPPIAALQRAALGDPNPRVRRECLGVLDHHASDASTHVFLGALADPVARVRAFALHGLSCERCRTSELCVADVTATVVELLATDSSPRVRHDAVRILDGLSNRDARATDALRRAAVADADPLVRQVAVAAVEGRRRDIRSRKALRRRDRHRTSKDVEPS